MKRSAAFGRNQVGRNAIPSYNHARTVCKDRNLRLYHDGWLASSGEQKGPGLTAVVCRGLAGVGTEPRNRCLPALLR
jgi:hypothetical protein